MYDLKKIVILGNFNQADTYDLKVYIMKTNGLRIDKLTYLADKGSFGEDEDEIIEELKSELYDDQYDENTKIKVKEVYDGKDAINKIVKFIAKNYEEDMLVYYYEPDKEVFSKICKKLEDVDSHIYIQEYSSLFGNQSDKNIYELMEYEGLKMENLIKDSQVSFIYYLSALVEQFMSR